ncbi:MAG TPA: UvrD-helicase domain-containing protein [Bacillota bacterium]|jgi:DNA helicase-4|nr:UvrD-helicase domain-containing protein [Bacillota bacterium]HOC07098.1 UvrD-helicase domain-containing protein [Bacillota bacterium]HQA08624.1 UvrD-helicase domain-containing protein [Syntrophomonadaceae bacterium]HQE24216.1 UvrD-helicase domain-containing protein [Syntrophomonadaceae bacterium]
MISAKNTTRSREKKRYDALFANIEGRSLDNQQRECIIKDEINNLVIAGAGSGKTTTIVGKVKYLLDRYSYQPNELLVLSFTNASAAEMSERIKKETGKDIDAMTFHKLGKEIIAQVEGKQPTVTNIDLTQFVEEQFSALSKEQKYRDIMLTYFLSYYKLFHSPMEFVTEGEYCDYLQDNQIVTFKGEKVKSFEEMEIANYLYINKIDYAYERPYKLDVATKTHSQYKPDFYLPDYGIYLEHFGIDRNFERPLE